MNQEDSTVAALSAEVESASLVHQEDDFGEGLFDENLLVSQNTGNTSVETHVETEVPKTYDLYCLKGEGYDDTWKVWKPLQVVSLGLSEPVRFYDDEVFGRVLHDGSWVVPRKKPGAIKVAFEIRYKFQNHVVTGDDYMVFV